MHIKIPHSELPADVATIQRQLDAHPQINTHPSFQITAKGE